MDSIPRGKSLSLAATAWVATRSSVGTTQRPVSEGPSGFKGGISAENYMRRTGISRATTTRDLQDLVDRKALIRVGALTSTRCHLCVTTTP